MRSLADNLRAVRSRIDAAAIAAGRRPEEVRLLAVSKTFPADDVRSLAALGQRDFAENRVQELTAKAAGLTDLGLDWHLVGQLQRNKAAGVVRLGATVHSVDRGSLVQTLASAAERAQRVVDVYVQVDLGGPEGEIGTRGGAVPEGVLARADRVADRPALGRGGLLAVAHRGEDPVAAFERLAAPAERVR